MINAKAGHLLIKLHQDEREELLDETAMKGQSEELLNYVLRTLTSRFSTYTPLLAAVGAH